MARQDLNKRVVADNVFSTMVSANGGGERKVKPGLVGHSGQLSDLDTVLL